MPTISLLSLSNSYLNSRHPAKYALPDHSPAEPLCASLEGRPSLLQVYPRTESALSKNFTLYLFLPDLMNIYRRLYIAHKVMLDIILSFDSPDYNQSQPNSSNPSFFDCLPQKSNSKPSPSQNAGESDGCYLFLRKGRLIQEQKIRHYTKKYSSKLNRKTTITISKAAAILIPSFNEFADI